jgi:hypothetical protein
MKSGSMVVDIDRILEMAVVVVVVFVVIVLDSSLLPFGPFNYKICQLFLKHSIR